MVLPYYRCLGSGLFCFPFFSICQSLFILLRVLNSSGEQFYEDLLQEKTVGLSSANSIVMDIAEAKSSSNDSPTRVFGIPQGIFPVPKKNVFIVHGHDTLSRLQLTNFLHNNNYHPIVLSDQIDGGATIIEKLEREFNNSFVSACIVLATPDDTYNGDTIARCRPNVELELGYAIARLGRRKLLVLKKTVPATMSFIYPSDIQGLVYTSFDAINQVEHKILTELNNITA